MNIAWNVISIGMLTKAGIASEIASEISQKRNRSVEGSLSNSK